MPTQKSLFLELAQPDKRGFSREVIIEEFVGKYAGLALGNGGSWCRDDGGLGKEYNIRRNKPSVKITSVSLQGFKKIPIIKGIRSDIIKHFKGEKCVMLGTGDTECDHKDGRRDDPRLNDTQRQTVNDFQPLSKAANNAKRQHCKECRNTGDRYDATILGFPVSQVKGNGKYNGTCIGCFWYDPIEFRKLVCRSK